MNYPTASASSSFFGRHPLLREIRNCLLAVICGVVFLGVVLWP